MRELALRRALGLIVSLAGLGPVVAAGCGGASSDSAHPTEGGTLELGQDRGISDDAGHDAASSGEGSVEANLGDGAGLGDSASDFASGDCGARTFQCTGPCVCSGGWLIDRQFTAQVPSSTACDLMKEAWPNGGNVPFGGACQTACADTTAMQCAVSDAYYAPWNECASS